MTADDADDRSDLIADIAALLALIDELADTDECHYDHHGYCQAHTLGERPCPHERANTLLRQEGRRS